MRKYFVCLANSVKEGARCIAGIELRPYGNIFRVVKQGREPKWLRPVTDVGHGEVPVREVSTLGLLDIVEVEVTEEAGVGFQSENVYYEPGSFNVIRRVNTPESALDELLTLRDGELFGSAENSIPVSEIAAVDHSLVLIEVSDFRPYLYFNKLKCDFNYNGTLYRRISITDPLFRVKFFRNNNYPVRYRRIFLTISLGIEFLVNHRHYKLVAGVFVI